LHPSLTHRSNRLSQTLPSPRGRHHGRAESGGGSREVRMNDSRPRRLGALFFPGFELLDTFGPLEMFGNMPGAIDIVTVAEQPCSTGCGAACRRPKSP